MRAKKPFEEKSAKKKIKKEKRGRFLKRFFLCTGILALSAVLFIAIYVLQMDAWHAFDPDLILNAPRSLLVYDGEGQEVSCLSGTETRIWAPLNQIPLHVQRAFIAAEDARFYEHVGVDIIRILGAAWEDIKAGAYVQGASTISQQLIKLSHLSNEKVMTRKMEEAVLAYQMEKRYSKDEILEMYLNYIYFGGGYYGIEAAARGYFGVPASELTVAQGAQLAGILKSPSRYAPHLNMDSSVGRRNLILGLMREYGFIDDETCRKARAEKVVLSNSLNKNVRGYYVDLALQEACATLNITMSELLAGGYKLHTAADWELQLYCEQLFADESTYPEGAEEAEAAIVIIDVQSGGVAALMGGRESTTALGYNRATRIRRQPGSVIKPVIAYAPALEYREYTTISMLLDEPTDFNGYQPGNFNQRYKGWVTMRDAVMQSLNVPAVKVLSDIGVNTGKSFAEQLGIEFDPQDTSLTLALGGFTYGVSPMQVAGAYAAFAAGGVYSTPSLVMKIEDGFGDIVYQYQPEETRVMSEANAYILTDMLKSAIQEGTGRRLNELGIELAGKTGTTGEGEGNRDAWMAAYNPQYAAAVWLGYDETGQLPQEVTGGTYPALILKSVFGKLYEEESAPVFSTPEDVVEIRLDGYTLQSEHVAVLANALTPVDSIVREVFVKGTEPQNSSEYWIIPTPPTLFAVELTPDGRARISFTPEKGFIRYALYREDAQGNAQKVGEWAGSTDTVTYIDPDALPGSTYAYYVLPIHPQLQIGGQLVVGPSTRKVQVSIPKNPFITNFEMEEAG